MKKVGRIFVWIGGSIGAVFFLAWAGFFVWERIEERKETAWVHAALAAEEMSERDVAGGATPEETYELFRAALAEGDADRAATYVIPEEREALRERIHTMDETMLPSWETLEEGFNSGEDEKEFTYIHAVLPKTIVLREKRFVVPAGPATQSIFFRHTTAADVWQLVAF